MTPRKPVWPPSLKLMPQHLEARDEYLEALVAHRVGATAGFDHGLTSLGLDDAALADGELVVSNLGVVFEDGQLAQCEGPLICSLTEALGEIGATADVFVVWANRSIDGSSVVDEVAETKARWKRVESKTTNGAVASLEPHLRLAVGAPPRAHESVLLGRFERGGNGVGFVDAVVPPLLSIHAFPPLRSWLSNAIAAVERRIAELVAARTTTPLEPTRFMASQAPPLHLLASLQRYLPRLRDMQDRRTAHPRELYDVLAALVGGLSIVSEARPDVVPTYRHATPGPSLSELFERLSALLARTARENILSFPFKKLDDTTYRATLRPEAFAAGRRPFLVASGADEQTLRDRVPSLVKIASGAALNPLLQSSVRGVSIAVEFDPPPQLPTRRSFVCYRLDVRDRHWADIRERLDMVIHLPVQSKTIEFTLYAVE